ARRRGKKREDFCQYGHQCSLLRSCQVRYGWILYSSIKEMTEQAMRLDVNAIIGVDLDYETIGDSMLMVSANGTGVVLE
ncbi:MAG: hypothetical protein EAZ32_00895, partial [Cytophagia bacterium]